MSGQEEQYVQRHHNMGHGGAADNFTSVSKRLINDLSRRFLPHGLAPDSRLARLEVELDELRAAKIEYARELRELRRRY